MKLDKDIALAFNFNTAPKELKDIAKQLRQKHNELQAAKNKSHVWLENRKRAQLEFDALYEEMQKLALNFNPSAEIVAEG